MTFRHWSGVTPYTSSCEFAGSCVFGKQLAENLSLRPPLLEIPHPPLTFSHRSGITPYTSSCELAGSCVFDKQSPGNLSLRPSNLIEGRPYSKVTAAILPSSLRTSHSFALVFSTLPPVSVCGTESIRLCLEVFLGSVLLNIGLAVASPLD